MDEIEIQCNDGLGETSECVSSSKLNHNNQQQSNHQSAENGSCKQDGHCLSDTEAQKMTVKMVNKDQINSSDSVDVSQQLAENQEQLVKARATIEKMQKQLTESENNGTKVDKMKMLAVKLKKDLASTKDELTRVQLSERETKEILKSVNKELERISILYQQSVKNFQNLQAEYDKLQDEFDQCKDQAKSVNSDLTSSVNELTKLKEEYAEKIIENDVLNSKINGLKEMVAEFERNNQDMESSLIVLRSELDEERKQKTAGQELAKSVMELKKELESKNNQLLELEKRDEIGKEISNKYNSLKPMYDELFSKKQALEDENKRLAEKLDQLEQQTKDLSLQLSEQRTSCEQLTNEKNKLLGKSKLLEEQYSRKMKTLSDKISHLEESAALADEELKKKDQEFLSYKLRVTNLLQKNQHSAEKEEEIVKLKSTLDRISAEKDALFQDLNSHKDEKLSLCNELKKRIDENEKLSKELEKIISLNETNHRLKAYNQELALRVRSQQEDFERKLKEAEESYEIKENSLREEISALKFKVSALEEELESLKTQKESPLSCKASQKELSPTISSSLNDLTTECPGALNNSECNYRTDYESGDNLSQPDTARRTPLSSISLSKSPATNPLYEILNSKDTDQEDELIKYVKQVGDLTQLMKETESNNALLTEQNRVLKEEIRRLQRIIERVESAKNLEYLKNVLVKFVACDTERSQLVPVLTTILKLSKPEEEIFTKFATTQHLNQTSPNSSPANQANNWSSYLWPSFTQQ